MSGRKKILSVLEHIKRESEINPDPELVKFEFNIHIVGMGILTDDQEKRIISKLVKNGVVEIHLPDGDNDEESALLSVYTPAEFMMEHNFIWIKLTPRFYRTYFWYATITFVENRWNYINPFWILWQLILGVISLIGWLWNKSKIATVITVLGGLLSYNWHFAKQNFESILRHMGLI